MDLGTTIGIILGGISLAMAIPSFLQMFFGRPALDIGYDAFTGNEGKVLLITIKNRLIKNPLLTCLGVVREAGDVSAFFDIRELGTNRYIEKDISGFIHDSATRQDYILVRALVGRSLGVTVIDFQFSENKPRIINARSNEHKILSEGDYAIDAQIICGQQVYKTTRNFKVGKEHHKIFWC